MFCPFHFLFLKLNETSVMLLTVLWRLIWQLLRTLGGKITCSCSVANFAIVLPIGKPASKLETLPPHISQMVFFY